MSKASLEQPGSVGDGIDGNDGNDPQGFIQPKPFQDSLVFNHESLCTAVYKRVYEQEFNSVILTAGIVFFPTWQLLCLALNVSHSLHSKHPPLREALMD